MHVNKLHSILRIAGLKHSKRQGAGLVKGYRPRLYGYYITERKERNLYWMSYGRKQHLPKFLPTGIFEIKHTDEGKIDTIAAILKDAGVSFETEEAKIVVDTNMEESQ